jgi:uncharacterized protein (TIGR00730 family)
MSVKRICVYCGSSSGAKPEYTRAAVELGGLLVKNNIELVYGGADRGLMGAVAGAVLSGGGAVTGVIPRSFAARVAHQGLTKLHVVDSMHARKQLLFDLSDGFIVLPGGLGTLEEMFEQLTWSQIGLHSKPCGILNVCGYFDRLLGFLDYSVTEQFVHQAHRDMILVEESPQNLLDKIIRYQAQRIDKWTGSRQRD